MSSTDTIPRESPQNSGIALTPRDLITQSETRLAALQREVARLQRVIFEQRAVINSNTFLEQTLPDDVLLHIFSILGSGSEARYPWILAAVCKRWRRVCLDHAILWSRIRLGLVHKGGTNSCDAYPAALATRLQIERSRTSPLHVTIDKTPSPCINEMTMFRQVMAHTHRWEELTLQHSAGFSWSQQAIVSLRRLIPVGSSFSRLRKLHWALAEGQYSLEIGEVSPMHLFSNCNALISLRQFSLADYIDDLSVLPGFPWAQLTSLDLACVGMHRQLVLAISKCNNLKSLALEFDDGDWDEHSMEDLKDSIVLPHVTIASICIQGTANGQGRSSFPFIPYVRLPRLRTFCVGHFMCDALSEVVVDLFARSSCSESLKELSLAFDVCKGDFKDKFASILHKLPQIEYLTLTHFWLYDAEPDAETSNRLVEYLELQDGSTGSWLCPQLQEIHFHDLVADPMILARTLDSRMNPRGEAGPTQRYLRSVKWAYPLNEQAYAICKTIMEHRYSESDIRLEMRYSSYADRF